MSSAALEEILKIIPIVPLIMTFQEMSQGGFSLLSLVKALAIHAPVELLTFKMKILSMPFRLAAHTLWNWWLWNKELALQNHNALMLPRRKISDFVERVEERSVEILRQDNIEVVDVPFLSEGVDIRRVDYQSELADLKLLPKNIRRQYRDTGGSKQNVLALLTPNIPILAANNTVHNLLHSICFRNLQPQKPSKIVNGVLRDCASLLRKTFFHNKDKNTSIEDWINLPNHTGPKKKLYETAYAERLLKPEDEIPVSSTIALKFDEVVRKSKFRTIIAFHGHFVIEMGPRIYDFACDLKESWNGYRIHEFAHAKVILFYATGVRTSDIVDVLQNWYPIRHDVHLMMFLGDDSLYLYKDSYRACDFSRYDSTQRPELRKLFLDLFEKNQGRKYGELLRKVDAAPVSVVIETVPYQFYVNGLKTGCPHTSVSNTTLTGAMFLFCLLLSDHSIKNKKLNSRWDFMEKFGVIPKWTVGSIYDGFEFLKHGFIFYAQTPYCVPLIGRLFKFGKFMKDLDLMVGTPYRKSSDYYKSRILLKAQYDSMGEFDNTPFWSLVSDALKKYDSSVELPNMYHNVRYQARRMPDTLDAMHLFYKCRYGLFENQIESIFDTLVVAINSDYVRVLWNDPNFNVAVEVDYPS